MICAEFVSENWQTREWCRELKSHLGKFMDPIADMLIRIKNAKAVKKEMVSVPYSSIKMAIAEKLVQADFFYFLYHLQI